MTSSAPWSVKGIDPDAREAAKEQARRSGMTLGEWLTQRIHEEGEEQAAAASVTDRGPQGPQGPQGTQRPLSQALDRLTARIEIAEQRSTLAVTGIEQSVRGVLARLEMTERDHVALGARFEGGLQEAIEGQAALTERVGKLEDHTAGPRSLEAIKGLEGSIARLANQLYDGEGRQRETNADLRRDLGAVAGRLDNVERSGAGLGGGDPAAAARMGERLDQAEARTTAALRSLEGSFSQLDRRLGATEERLDGGGLSDTLERRLGDIAANLASGVEASRIEMAEQLRASADGRFDRMELALKAMDEHVQAAEHRSAEAIERMGREVLRVAEALNRKVITGEQRAADAIEQVGGEVSRVVGSLDARLHRAETAQGLALEKVGSDIARVAERLTERIGSAERRSAQAIDDVGEQISRVTERLNQRYDRSASDLAERIRQSEERTVRLLEEARERLDSRLVGGERARTESAAPTLHRDPFDAPPFPGDAPAAVAEAAPPQYVIYPDVAPFGQGMEPQVLAAHGFNPVEPDFDVEDIEAASGFAAPVLPQTEADFIDGAAPVAQVAPVPAFGAMSAPEPIFDAHPFDEDAELDHHPDDLALHDFAAEPPPPAPESNVSQALSTRELIEQARASARAQAGQGGGSRRRPDMSQAVAGGGFAGVPFVTRRKKKDRTRQALAASFVIAAVMLTGGGVIYATGGFPNQVAHLFGGAPQTVPDDQSSAPRMAVALNPQPITSADGLTPVVPTTAAADAGPDASDLLAQGRAKIDAKDKGGLDLVKRAANLGDAEAQRYLASLYKDGKAGLTKNLPEARRWYERAAAGGDRLAMHVTALMQYAGDGGPKNQTSAAEWFRKAADLGATDSQYNLGVLYELGTGVAKNPAEAYKWYLLAARDTNEAKRNDARAAADRVKGEISVEAQSAAERFAASFTPQIPAGAAPQLANAAPAAPIDYTTAQKALARLGYYKGAANGTASDELRTAIREYQRDQGIAQSGALDSATSDKLKVYAR